MIKRILLLAIVIGGGMTTVAQNSIDTLFMSVSQRLSGHPSELIYLQTGKDIYETGGLSIGCQIVRAVGTKRNALLADA